MFLLGQNQLNIRLFYSCTVIATRSCIRTLSESTARHKNKEVLFVKHVFIRGFITYSTETMGHGMVVPAQTLGNERSHS